MVLLTGCYEKTVCCPIDGGCEDPQEDASSDTNSDTDDVNEETN